MTGFGSKLRTAVMQNNSLLCVGLDPDATKIPADVNGKNKLYEFNKAIIDATADLVCAFKPNSAFYEAHGVDGVEQLRQTCEYIKQKYPSVPIILDFKRADIGNTSESYARFAFDYIGADAITVQPYMGQDTITPFTNYKEKGVIVLCRTSNPSAGEFQDLKVGTQELYKVVAEHVATKWNINGNCLLMVGATYPDELKEVRAIAGDMDVLIAGIGAQEGALESTIKNGLNSQQAGLIVNASRSIIFASEDKDYAQASRVQAQKLRDQINSYRKA